MLHAGLDLSRKKVDVACSPIKESIWISWSRRLTAMR